MAHYAAYPDDGLIEPRRPAHRRRTHASAWILRTVTGAVIIGALVLLADLAISITDGLSRFDGRVSDPTPIDVVVAGQRLSIPSNMFRFPAQRRPGRTDRVDLVVHWPEMTGYAPAYRDDFLDTGADAPLVFLSIKPQDTVTDSADRLINVYQHFFAAGSIPAPAGLIGHRMSRESGLENEEVYFEAGSTTPFTTHCLALDDANYPSTCVTEIHAGEGLSVQFRFRKGMLDNWAGIKSGIRVLLLSFGVIS